MARSAGPPTNGGDEPAVIAAASRPGGSLSVMRWLVSEATNRAASSGGFIGSPNCYVRLTLIGRVGSPAILQLSRYQPAPLCTRNERLVRSRHNPATILFA